jgi:hypothetical protein
MAWVKLVFLEARIRPVEHFDKRLPWTAEGRTMLEPLSRSRDWVLIIRDDGEIDQIKAFTFISCRRKNNLLGGIRVKTLRKMACSELLVFLFIKPPKIYSRSKAFNASKIK